jgi:hypothetical protein
VHLARLGEAAQTVNHGVGGVSSGGPA